MKIAIDLSPIQGYHRMRGIGYTLINFINGLPEEQRRDNHFVFFLMPYKTDSQEDPLGILNLEELSYEVRTLELPKKSVRKLPGRLNLLVSVYNNLLEIKSLALGDSRFKDLSDIDVFLQTDQSQSLPRRRGIKKVLIAYDIIPYSVEWDYLWTYQTARGVYGFSRKAAFRCHVRRGLYLFKLKLNVGRADSVLAISRQTAQEFSDKLHVPTKKLIVTPLGVNLPVTNTKPEGIKLHEYVKTSWGYRLRALEFDPKIPFILFVGGADKRRKLEDLVAAFNGLRAEGHNFKLILAGDSMQGPDNIATEEIQYALKTSSYLEDIIFMGFVDDKTRDWLYKTARCFIFPSRYEGFGLPVLEAMAYQCPVISYPNKATKEVAGDQIEYVNNIEELKAAILKLLRADNEYIKDIRAKNLSHAKKYSWNKTAQDIIQRLSLN